MQQIDLQVDNDGVFTVPDLTSTLEEFGIDFRELNLPDVGSYGESIAELERELAREQVKMVRGARAIQEGVAAIKAMQAAHDEQLKIKDKEKGNRNFIHTYAGPGYVESVQVTPFLKRREHRVSVKW